jgi:hypothetical protein
VAATPEELVSGVLRVFEYDVEALIEPFIKNRLELNVAVAGLDEPVASVTEMPLTSKDAALSFSEKYKKQGGKSIGSSEGMAGALRVLDPPAADEAAPRCMRPQSSLRSACEGIAHRFLIDADTGALASADQHVRVARLLPLVAAPHYWTSELLALIDRAERCAPPSAHLASPPDLRCQARGCQSRSPMRKDGKPMRRSLSGQRDTT